MDVVDDDGHSAEGHQNDGDQADDQETGVEATAPPRLPPLLLSASLGNVRRDVAAPGKVSVTVVSVAATEEKLAVFDVLQTGVEITAAAPVSLHAVVPVPEELEVVGGV